MMAPMQACGKRHWPAKTCKICPPPKKRLLPGQKPPKPVIRPLPDLDEVCKRYTNIVERKQRKASRVLDLISGRFS